MKSFFSKVFYYSYKTVSIAYVTLIILYCFCIASLVIGIFLSTDINTLPITNYSFAIFGGISSICFSWARNINPNKKKHINKINGAAQTSLFTAITFLFASIMRYITIQTFIPIDTSKSFYRYFLKVSSEGAGCFFMISSLIGSVTLYLVLMALLETPRINSEKDESQDAE